MPELTCPSCKTVVSTEAVAHLAQAAQFVVSHVRCTQCAHAYMVVNSTNEGQSILVLATELTQQELLNALSSRALTPDDVISLHRMLAERNSTRYLSLHR